MPGFTNKVLALRQEQVFTIQARDYTGRKAWYKLHVAPAKHAAFLKAFEQGLSCDLTAYGSILDSGYGELCQDVL